MAKKKTVKKVKKEKDYPVSVSDETITKALKDGVLETRISEFNKLEQRLNARIDRIVAAHDKCKSLKGL